MPATPADAQGAINPAACDASCRIVWEWMREGMEGREGRIGVPRAALCLIVWEWMREGMEGGE